MAILTEKSKWPLITQEANMKKGCLVRVSLGHGQFVKMYESDAIAQGKLPSKAKPQAANKMRLPQENKSVPEAPEVENAPIVDDFSTIPGIGKAAARALVGHGITTFEQLRQAGSLDYLLPKTLKAIEEWRSGK